MIDRQALTLRTLTIAALAVMLLAPESVVHPSFQMSFAATLALIAAYERGLPWMIAGADTSRGARIALWGGREVLALIVASLVAGLATTIYAAFHFHRLAPYGVLANLLAMPIVSAWTMPAGLIGLIAMPFGYDRPFWQLMGLGIDWMITVANWIASLPGAVGHIAAFGVGPLLLATAGFVTLCLLKTPLRWSGGALLVIACVWAIRAPLPDVLVSADGQAFAVRTSSGQLAFYQARRNVFAIREWLAADGDARDIKDAGLGSGLTCDSAGCIGTLAGNSKVAVVLTPEAFEEDCRRAALVVTARVAPPYCSAMVIDRQVWRSSGALTLRRVNERFEVVPSRPAGYDRPWARSSTPPNGPPAGGSKRRTIPRSPDATPDRNTLEADD
jgi:competence protein ComEC